jgi:hypothetical protein
MSIGPTLLTFLFCHLGLGGPEACIAITLVIYSYNNS